MTLQVYHCIDQSHNMNLNALRKAFGVLHSDMQRAFAACHSTTLTPVVKTVDSQRKLPLPSGVSSGSDYFPDEIRNHIMNEPSVAITYSFSVGDRKVVLHFVEFNQQPAQLNMKELLADAERVCALLHLVSLHAIRATCSSKLCIYVYLTDFKKRFPTRKGATLDAEHVNTGMSYHCAKDNDVVVYRREEWFKVLIHELFHAMGLSFIDGDMSAGVDAAMQAVLQKMYAISHPVRVYETYCEIWARVLNTMFACFIAHDHDENSTPLQLQVFMECVMERLHADAKFAHTQCGKLLKYMDLTHDVLGNPTPDNRALVAKKYRENTNVFAYYVLTCVLLHSPDAFMTWCYKNNPCAKTKTATHIMQFRTIPSNFNGFMELLRHCKQQCPGFDSHGWNDADVLGSSMRMTTH
jgi:hypothetical protein